MSDKVVFAWAVKNCTALFVWTALAIIFNTWWIALFALLFMSSLKTEPKYYRICDKCGKHSPYADSPSEALLKAKEAKWVHYSGNNTDYCPECK